MAIGVEQAVENVELEAFASEIPTLIPMSKTLYSLMQEKFTKEPVSYTTAGGATVRPSFRVPFRAQGSAAISQGTGDGQALGRGNMSVWQSFVLSPVWHFAVNEMSHLSQLATNGKKRGLISLKAEEFKNSLDSTIAGLEAMLYGDGSGAITQIPANATVITTSPGSIQSSSLRAMAVTDNQVLQFFANEGGVARGYATVSTNDPASGTINFVGGLAANGSTPTNGTSLASNVVAGDWIMIAGSTGSNTTLSSVLGIQAWHNSATTGTIAGYNRATYPGRVTTPSINLNSGAVVASLSQRIEALLGRAMGADNKAKDSGVYLMGEDQAYAIATTNYYNKQITQNSDQGGGGDKSVPDTSRKYFQKTFGGRDVTISYVQPLGRIDLLLTKNWYIGELVPLQLYDFGGGNTVMPTPDPAGNGWLTSNQFVYETSLNVANSAPKQGLFVYGASTPIV